MSKKILIKEINDIYKMNIICSNAEEIRECLNILDKLGLDAPDVPFDNNFIVVSFQKNVKMFVVYEKVNSTYKNISFYNFKQETKKFLSAINTPVEDIEYDLRTGRVIKINNYKSHKYIFIVSDGFFLDANPIENYSRDYLDFIVYIGLAYISKETCDKAKQEMIKRVEEENKKIGKQC